MSGSISGSIDYLGREMFLLHVVDGKSFADIAKEFNTNPKQVSKVIADYKGNISIEEAAGLPKRACVSLLGDALMREETLFRDLAVLRDKAKEAKEFVQALTDTIAGSAKGRTPVRERQEPTQEKQNSISSLIKEFLEGLDAQGQFSLDELYDHIDQARGGATNKATVISMLYSMGARKVNKASSDGLYTFGQE